MESVPGALAAGLVGAFSARSRRVTALKAGASQIALRLGAKGVYYAASDVRRHGASLLRDLYAPYHFDDRLGPDGLVFDYRLSAGPAVTRNAIALLAQYGAPPALVDRALARVAELDDHHSGIAKRSSSASVAIHGLPAHSGGCLFRKAPSGVYWGSHSNRLRRMDI